MKRKQIEVNFDNPYQYLPITFNLEDMAILEIDDIADKEKKSRSKVLREAIHQWIAWKKQQRKS